MEIEVLQDRWSVLAWVGEVDIVERDVASALDELVLTWATGDVALGPQHWPPIVARRRELLEKLNQFKPPPALGVTPGQLGNEIPPGQPPTCMPTSGTIRPLTLLP